MSLEIKNHLQEYLISTDLKARLEPCLRNLLTPGWKCVAPVRPEAGESVTSILTRELIGTQKTRFTRRPNETCIASMQLLIRQCVDNSRPIPILVPMGPKKPKSDMHVDIAEILALKTLSALHQRLQIHHPPGAKFFFREEDVTGWILEAKVPTIREDIERYLGQFEMLIKFLGFDHFMCPVRESQLTSLEAFSQEVKLIKPHLAAYIQESDKKGIDNYTALPSWASLSELGWVGPIPSEQREYYRSRYHFLYPDRSDEEIDAMMVQYLASSLARYRLKANYPPELYGNFIQLNFAPPIPGVPKELVSRKVYYRTAPRPVTKRHIPFWRARGVIKEANGVLKPSLINFHQEDPLTLYETTLVGNDCQLQIQISILH